MTVVRTLFYKNANFLQLLKMSLDKWLWDHIMLKNSKVIQSNLMNT